MLIVDNNLLHTLQRDVNNVFDILKTLVRRRLSPGLLQVKPQILDAPFTSMLRVKIVLLLLDSIVRQMDHHVVHLADVGTVILCTESGET